MDLGPARYLVSRPGGGRYRAAIHLRRSTAGDCLCPGSNGARLCSDNEKGPPRAEVGTGERIRGRHVLVYHPNHGHPELGDRALAAASGLVSERRHHLLPHRDEPDGTGRATVPVVQTLPHRCWGVTWRGGAQAAAPFLFYRVSATMREHPDTTVAPTITCYYSYETHRIHVTKRPTRANGD